MRLKLISCAVFKPELGETDAVFVPIGEHAAPERLRARLQAEIDSAQGVDAVLLLFGLCGNATAELTARDVPVLIPRAHDCAGILLGGMERWRAVFGERPSRPYRSAGNLEDPLSAENLTARYGEEEARRLQQELHLEPPLFIRTVPCAHACPEEVQGTTALIEALLRAEPHPDLFILQPGETSRADVLHGGVFAGVLPAVDQRCAGAERKL